MRITGTYEQLDGQPVVRFERTFPHPVEAVWAAVTDPTALEQWFPTTVEFTELRPGEPIAFRFAEVVGGRPPRRPASGERGAPTTRSTSGWGCPRRRRFRSRRQRYTR